MSADRQWSDGTEKAIAQKVRAAIAFGDIPISDFQPPEEFEMNESYQLFTVAQNALAASALIALRDKKKKTKTGQKIIKEYDLNQEGFFQWRYQKETITKEW